LHQLIRNPNSEREIRAWLNGNGYYGNSAQLANVELFAIERPGWKQVFEFEAKAKDRDSDQWSDHWGTVFNDHDSRQNYKHKLSCSQNKVNGRSGSRSCRKVC